MSKIEFGYVEDGVIYLNNGDEYDFYEYSYQIDALEKGSGIRILRGKEINTIVFDTENNSIIGAMYTEFDGKEFSFDVIVHPEYQRQGIGKKLIDIALNQFNNYDDAVLSLDVVNYDLVKYLVKRGLKIKSSEHDHTIMGEKYKTEEELIWERYILKENPLSNEFDYYGDDDDGDGDGDGDSFHKYYTDGAPEKYKNEKVFYGRNVEWVAVGKYVIKLDSEYISSREDNITDNKKVYAVKRYIENSEDRVRLNTPPADIRIINTDYIEETQRSYHNDTLDLDFRISEPFTTGDDDVDKYLYMDKNDFSEHMGLDPDYVNDDGTPNIDEISYYEEDEEDVESLAQEIIDIYSDIKERLQYCIDKKTGDIGQLWGVLRDGNHRTWGAILSGENYIYCYPHHYNEKDLEDLKPYIINS